MDKNIFHEYDIRGTYPTQINESVMYTIGLSYGSYIQKYFNMKKCVIGHDNRLSSESLNEQMINGILDSGCDVVDIGLVTTPIIYYARYSLNLCGGIITASHNPKDDNGFKFSFNTLYNACGKEIFDFRDFTLKNEFLTGQGSLEKKDIVDEYINYIKNDVKMGNRPLKVAIDCGNGTTSLFVKDVFEGYGFDVHYLYAESDGSFPNHHPDSQVEEYLEDLKKYVKDNNMDAGISFDGDGDRFGMINEAGEFVEPSYNLIIFMRSIINNLSNKTIQFDVKCSNSLEEDIISHGGIPYVYKVGASYAHKNVIDNNFGFGGEYSGHLYFNDRIYPNTCGLYAGLRLLEILSNCDKSVSELYDGITKYESYPEEKISCEHDMKKIVIENIKNHCLENNYSFSDIDGIRATFSDGWALVRASNTGPNLTTRYESTNKTRLDEIKKEFDEIIKRTLS